MELDRLRRMAGITTITEGGNNTSFDTQVHPEEHPDFERAEAQHEYSQVAKAACEGTIDLVNKIAKEHGWAADAVWHMIVAELEHFFPTNDQDRS